MYAVSAPLRIRAGKIALEAPQGGAVWLPPRFSYVLEGKGEAQCIDIPPAQSRDLPWRVKVFIVPAFLRQLLGYLAEQNLAPAEARHRIATALAIEEIRAVLRTPRLQLPWDARLLQIAKAIISEPADNTDLNVWAARVGLSTRHITRMFHGQTGLSFADWRAQIRANLAKDMLCQGSIGAVAGRVGYTSKGAFIRMFKRVTGTTPRQYRRGACGPD